MARRRALIVLILISLLGTGACSRDRSGPPRRLNLLLIVVDTLRADHLGVYGYARNTSPHVDAFARRSLFFRNARSQAACTFPSVNSILTSRYPFAFLDQLDQAMGIPEAIPSIAEILHPRGYRTVAISTSAIVRQSPSHRNPTGGFGRGFDEFHEDCLWRPAKCVNQQAFAELDRARGGDAPLFLYLHYIDPHDPYAPPDSYERRFAHGCPAKDFIRKGSPNPIGKWIYRGGPDPGVTPEDLQHLRDLYDDEIAYFDGQFKELLHALESGGWLDNSIVVFAADHGEEFLEHGHIEHCRAVFDTLVKTPLFVHVPGVAARTIEEPVQNLDIMPTLLDYAGVPAGPARLEGRSLRPLINQKIDKAQAPPGDPHQYSLAGPYRGVADGRFKLIEHLGTGDFQLFDLRRDPGETNDVRAAERRSFHRLRGALSAWIDRTEGVGQTGESLRKTREAEEKLRALGYLQ
ncbi:MAG TPA: sulfatase [Thermoanaerobaculia bacterium]|nr:sulfatase [Thermoanaerobaculia bacterium]